MEVDLVHHKERYEASRKYQKNAQLQTEDAEWSSGESNKDAAADFENMTPVEQSDHVFELWKKCFMKSMGAAIVLRNTAKIIERQVLYGSVKNINSNQAELIKNKILSKRRSWILMPDHPFLRFWNMVMIVLMAYVVSYVPFNICFDQSISTELTLTGKIDIIVDILFFVDILVNFVSAYDDPTTSLPVVKPRVIAKNYLKFWFWLDLITVLPFNYLETVFIPE